MRDGETYLYVAIKSGPQILGNAIQATQPGRYVFCDIRTRRLTCRSLTHGSPKDGVLEGREPLEKHRGLDVLAPQQTSGLNKRTVSDRAETLKPSILSGIHRSLPLGLVLVISACASEPSAPAATILPGQGKPLAAFQQDDLVCQRHALAHAGYNDPEQPIASGPDERPPDGVVPDEPAYLQCMAARGNTIQLNAPPYALPTGAPGYSYTYEYPPYASAFVGGFGFGGFGGGRWHHGGWHHGGGHHGWGGRAGGFGHGGGGHR